MPDIFGADHQRFLEWIVSSSPEEHSLSEPLLSEVRAALDSPALRNGGRRQLAGERELPPLCAELLENGSQNSAFAKIMNGEAANSPEALNEPARLSESGLTVLAQYVYESRPDLQRAFPEVGGKDQAAFLIWFLTSGRDDYSLSEEYLVPIRERLHQIRAGLPVVERLRMDIRRGMFAAARQARPLTAVVRKARRDRRPAAQATKPRVQAPLREPSKELTEGVNVYGYFVPRWEWDNRLATA